MLLLKFTLLLVAQFSLSSIFLGGQGRKCVLTCVCLRSSPLLFCPIITLSDADICYGLVTEVHLSPSLAFLRRVLWGVTQVVLHSSSRGCCSTVLGPFMGSLDRRP